MKILFCSAEVSPFAKVGGLADVAGSLPKALAKLGHDVLTLMPAYGMAREAAGSPEPAAFGTVLVSPGRAAKWTLFLVRIEGLRLALLDVDGVAAPIARSEEVYGLDRDDYLAWSKAAIAACEALEWIPDLVHANDWHTGFLPVFVREWAGERWARTACVFTIHNLAYQGEFGVDTVAAAGLPMSLYEPHLLETFGGVNFLKSGCVYADQVNTVSPTYAKEILTETYGCKLWGLMRHLDALGKLRGILNGIDTETFDPATDPAIAANYSATDPSGKKICRAALARECGWDEEPDVPIAGVVSRLSEQKGFDLIVQACEAIAALPMRLVVLGKGSPHIACDLRRLEKALPSRVKLFEVFDVDLAQRIYAGSDLFLMPSAFEPCGLGQMIALRYGSLPVVRATGGLVDTVIEGRNGFVFREHLDAALFAAVRRASEAYASPDWSDAVRRAMLEDFSWQRSALEYEQLYRDALESRQAELIRSVSSAG